MTIRIGRARTAVRRTATAMALLVSFGLAACSGGSDSGTASAPPVATPDPAPAPTPAPSPTGDTFQLDGAAIKGLILNGVVNVFDPADPNTPLTSGTTSATNGTFDLSIPASANFTGDLVQVVVSGGPGATMICDVAAGCGTGIVFGDTFPIGADVTLTALVSAPGNGETDTVNVSALTDLAARLAEAAAADGDGELSLQLIEQASSQVAGLFGITSNDLAALPAVDVTSADADTSNEDAVRAALMNAGLLSAALEGTSDVGTALDAFADTFVENNGQIVANEGVDNDVNTVSLEDILDAAVDVAGLSPIDDTGVDGIVAEINGDLAAVQAETPGALTNEQPSPTAGNTDLDKAKAFVSDLQLVIAAVENDESASDIDAFFSRAGDAAELVGSDAAGTIEAAAITALSIAEAFDVVLASEELPETVVTGFGLTVNVSVDEGGNLLLSVDEEIEGFDIALTGTVAPGSGAGDGRTIDDETGDIDRIFNLEGAVDFAGTVGAGDVQLTLDALSIEIDELRVDTSETVFGDFVDEDLAAALIAFELDGKIEDASSETGVAFDGMIGIDFVDVAATRRDLFIFGGGINGVGSTYVNAESLNIGFAQAGLMLGGTLSEGGESFGVSLSLDAESAGTLFSDAPELFENIYTLDEENNVLTIDVATGRTLIYSFIEAADVQGEIDALGVTLDETFSSADLSFRLYDIDPAVFDRRVIQSMNEGSDEIVFKLDLSGSNNVITGIPFTPRTLYTHSSLVTTFLPAAVTSTAFLENPPTDDIIDYYNGVYLDDAPTAGLIYCIDDQLILANAGEPIPIDRASLPIVADGIIIDSAFPCEFSDDLYFDLFAQRSSGLAADAEADLLLSASVSQNIVGIDAEDPEVTLSASAPASLAGETLTGEVSLQLDFAGRRFETDAVSFDVFDQDDFAGPITVTNQDDVIMTLEEGDDGLIDGTLTIGDVLFASITENSSGIITVDFSDDSFVSIL